MLNTLITNIPYEQVVKPSILQGATKSEVRKVAEDFESMFLAEMLRPMFEQDEQVDPMFGGSHEEGMFKSLLIDEYGKGISAQGGLGIADNIEAQLLKYQEVQNGYSAS